jgi:oligopeptide transport system permease protein
MGKKQYSARQLRIREVLRSPVMIAACLIIVFVVGGVISTFVREYLYRNEHPTQKDFFEITFIQRDTDHKFEPPSAAGWFGFDHEGMSVAERTFAGACISLLVGVLGALVSVTVGTLYGLIAGYVGGKTDMLMMRFVDVMYSLPYMFIVILLIAIFSRSVWLLFIALGLVYWLTIARIVRGQVLSLKEREFVAAARTIGAGHLRIIFRHILPNLIGIVIVYLTLTVPRLMLQESFLSFLGLNVLGQEHSWGTILKDASVTGTAFDWWIIVFTGGIMFLSLLAITVIGEKMREIIEQKPA